MQKTTSPNESWKPGDKIHSPVKNFDSVDPTKQSSIDNYKLLIGTIVPRPIAFVSTVNSAGKGNLAPFSFFTGISSNPMCCVISVAIGKDGEKKDTLRNIEETGEFVINGTNEWLIEAVCHTAGAYPHGVDELQKVGLSSLDSVVVKPKRVAESATQMECVVEKLVPIGDGSPGSTVLVVGKVVYYHVWDEAFEDGKIKLEKIQPAARLGGFGYSSIGDYYDLTIPSLEELVS